MSLKTAPIATARPGIRAAWRAAAALALLAMPLATLRGPPGGPLRWLAAGSRHLDRALPEFRELNPPVVSSAGYDGQFYAQLALDPALDRSDEIICALDSPEYRAHRIGLPALAWLAGGGHPRRTVLAYSLANLVFAALLIGMIAARTGAARLRDFVLMASLIWTTGAMTSITRALSDLPAAVLLLAGVWVAGRPMMTGGAFAAAALMRESSLFALPVLLPVSASRRSWAAAGVAILIAVSPVVLWIAWCRLRLGGAGASPVDAFGAPGVAWATRVAGAAHDLVRLVPDSSWAQRGRLVFEFLAPLSLAVQALFFVVRRDLRAPLWRLGAAASLLFLVLGPQVWIEQYASTRVLLPLTFAFNASLHEAPGGKPALAWFAAGNTGLLWCAISAVI